MPSNTVLTPDKILRAAYAVMHQKSNFIMRTNRQYDDQFARTGAKIGQQLRVRLPAKYTVRTGNTMASQNYVERSVPLPLATIKGVDLNFGQEELTFSLEDFTERVIEPAASQLISAVEADAFSMINSVPNYAGDITVTTSVDYLSFQTAGRYLSENLAPSPGRTAILSPQARVLFSNDTKSLFQSADNIRQQYVEGLMGRTGGFDVFENTIVPAHTTGGGSAATASITTSFDGTGNAWSPGPFELTIAGAFSFKKGDIVTFAVGDEVHPETKQSLGYKKRFVIAEDKTNAAGDETIKILPAPIATGAYQNVSAPISGTVTVLGTNGSTASALSFGQNLLFHRDAFAFVTADLEDPAQYGAWGARRVEDGLSLRIWRQGDIANGNFPCRLDIAYGYAPIYPEWAARLVHAR